MSDSIPRVTGRTIASFWCHWRAGRPTVFTALAAFRQNMLPDGLRIIMARCDDAASAASDRHLTESPGSLPSPLSSDTPCHLSTADLTANDHQRRFTEALLSPRITGVLYLAIAPSFR